MTSSVRSLSRNSFLFLFAAASAIYGPAAALAAELTDSIVTIYAKSKISGSSQGTGFVLGPGLIGTACHVVMDASEIEVFDYRARKHVRPTLDWLDAKRDLAVLSIPTGKDLPTIPVASTVPSPQH